MSKEIGIITEQGDLGLGFDPLNQNDQKVYNESASKEEDKKTTENNK